MNKPVYLFVVSIIIFVFFLRKYLCFSLSSEQKKMLASYRGSPNTEVWFWGLQFISLFVSAFLIRMINILFSINFFSSMIFLFIFILIPYYIREEFFYYQYAKAARLPLNYLRLGMLCKFLILIVFLNFIYMIVPFLLTSS